MTILNVQHAISPEGSSTSVTSLALAFGATVTSGNTVVGTIAYSGTAPDAFTSITDDKSNTYNTVAKFLDSTNTEWCSLFYLQNITNGPKTITLNLNAGRSFVAMAIAEFSGIATASPTDGSASQLFAGGTGTDAVTSGNFTTAANGDLIYSAFYDQAVAGATFTHGTGFSALDIASSAGTFPFGHEWMVQSAASSTTAGTWTQSISGGTDVLAMALKAATTVWAPFLNDDITPVQQRLAVGY